MLPEDIIAKVQQDFSEDDAITILQMLSELQKEDPKTFFDRILRCIVFLAHGRFEEFAEAVALARIDWRDLIVIAEYDGWSGEENRRRDFSLPFKIYVA
jgi:hypothetical protein